MPRFAANLGFTPLEPLKPLSRTTSFEPQPITTAMSVANTSTSTTMSTMSSISHNNNKNNGNNTSITTNDAPLGNIITGDVPAAQFDWNSSGLVNPLDGK